MAKIFYLNCIESGYDTLIRLLKNGVHISYIVTLTQKQAIKYNVSGYKNFKPISKQFNIPIYHAQTYNLKSKKDYNFFLKQKPDLLLVHGWQRLIPKNILELLSIGALGDHGSSQRLPKGRGRSPINWCIITNKKKFLLHLFLMDKNVDSGKIIDVTEFDINQFDNCRTVYHKKTIALTRMLLKNLPQIISGDIKLFPQRGNPSYFKKRNIEDGLINWKKSTNEIYNLIRACTTPYPCAFFYLDGKRILVQEAQPFDTKIKYPHNKVGDIVEIFNDRSFVVKTKDNTLLVKKYFESQDESILFKEVKYNNQN